MNKEHLDLLYKKRADTAASIDQIVREIANDLVEENYLPLCIRKDERNAFLEQIDEIIESYITN